MPADNHCTAGAGQDCHSKEVEAKADRGKSKSEATRYYGATEACKKPISAKQCQ